MPAGRPTDYREAYCATVIECGKQGQSLAQMADACGTVRQRLYEWEKDFPEFHDALTRAKELSMIWWEQKAQTSLETPGFQASLWSRSMAARFPADYTEKQQHETNGTLKVEVVRSDALTIVDDET